MNFIQNQLSFKVSNFLKALGLMVAVAVGMYLAGVHNGIALLAGPVIVVWILAPAFNKFAAKKETAAQAEASALQHATVISLADHRSGGEVEVAA